MSAPITPVVYLLACLDDPELTGDTKMKFPKTLALPLMGFLLLVAFAVTTEAEVKQVRMKIAGYLCGN